MLLVDDILRLPIDLGMKVLRTLAEQVDDELLRTEESVRKRVMETQLKYESGEIKEEEYREMMDYLKKRLEEVKKE
ncbi:MAG: CdvA-like protein [Methanophagales archaeon]|nr:CdvA-like protein [Methanophagales archaeon]